jgi:hypothetical protein
MTPRLPGGHFQIEREGIRVGSRFREDFTGARSRVAIHIHASTIPRRTEMECGSFPHGTLQDLRAESQRNLFLGIRRIAATWESELRSALA